MNSENDVISALPILLGFTAFATVGSLVISRYPRHGIGWIFALVGLGTMTQNYAVYALFTRPGSLPGALFLAWAGNWLWPISMALIAFLPLLYPDEEPLR